MLRKFLKSRAVPDAPTAAVPDGRRVYAIGDVHGCGDLLDRLLAMIEADDAARAPALRTTVFLGDLVDRGPDSAGVLDRVVALRAGGGDVRVLKGNHEEVFLAALAGDPKALRLFCRVGGRETAISYGITPEAYDLMGYDQLAEALASLVPESHRALLDSATDMEVIGDFAFVHAGVRPDRPLDDQRGADLRWIRSPFLDHTGRLEKMIVHGHTIVPTIERRTHRIGIDTGAYDTGRLTAMAFEGDSNWHFDTV